MWLASLEEDYCNPNIYLISNYSLAMVTTTHLGNNIYKFTGNDVVNCFLIKEESILVDTGNPVDRAALKEAIEKIMPVAEIQTVLLTHLHYDHSGNVCIFPNAKFYTSKEEINAFKELGSGLTFDMFGKGINEDIKACKLISMSEFENPKIRTLFTPGHTPGEISFLYTVNSDSNNTKTTKYLFSGDVIFENGFGRIDFPSAVPEKMAASIKLLQDLDYEVLCPGHDY
jgi:hydroxyacylglutathione hydrolase